MYPHPADLGGIMKKIKLIAAIVLILCLPIKSREQGSGWVSPRVENGQQFDPFNILIGSYTSTLVISASKYTSCLQLYNNSTMDVYLSSWSVVASSITNAASILSNSTAYDLSASTSGSSGVSPLNWLFLNSFTGNIYAITASTNSASNIKLQGFTCQSNF